MPSVSWFLIACSAVLLIYWWRVLRPRAAGRRSPAYLIVYDGATCVLYDAKRDAAGNLVTDGITYPAGVPVRVVNESSIVSPVYVLGAESLALASHATLEMHRRHIVMGNIFKSGGDLMELLRMVATLSVVAVALYAVFSLSSVTDSNNDVMVELARLRDQISQPMKVIPESQVQP